MTQEQADADASVVTGTILISGIPAIALIDSGSTHSFASCAFVRKLGITPDLLKVRYSVTVPSGEEMDSNQMLRACSIQISDRTLYADLVVLPMPNFEVILGMDWLTKYHATIDCNKKIVIFQPPGEEQFMFNGISFSRSLPIIFALKAQKMLNKGCVGYLASVLDTSVEAQLKPENVDVVQEFVEVFPDDLPGLPPNREIEFVIDVMPGTTSISKAPYRMAPTELKELKVQLQELLDKGFICPSYSPWGAPVLFVKKKDGTLRLCIDYRELNG